MDKIDSFDPFIGKFCKVQYLTKYVFYGHVHAIDGAFLVVQNKVGDKVIADLHTSMVTDIEVIAQ